MPVLKKRLIEIGFLIFLTAICTISLKQDANAAITYYGPGFAGKTMANGEVYDPSAMTAAHPSLPFGTVISVNGVDVEITDRCSCQLDLSDGAYAKAFGGTAEAANASASESSASSAPATPSSAAPDKPQVTELPKTGGPIPGEVVWVVWVIFKVMGIPTSVL